MQRILNMFVVLLLFIYNAGAQIHSLAFSAPDPADSLVAPLLGVISGPVPNCEFRPEGRPDVTQQYRDIGVMFVRNNDYYDDRLDMERLFRCPDTSTYPSWNCDPDDPSNYHYEGSDELFDVFLSNGFIPFFGLAGSINIVMVATILKGLEMQPKKTIGFERR